MFTAYLLIEIPCVKCHDIALILTNYRPAAANAVQKAGRDTVPIQKNKVFVAILCDYVNDYQIMP